MIFNSHTIKSLFLVLVALIFGAAALDYKIGHFGKAGPGLFPLVVSGMLLVIGLVMLIKSRFEIAQPLHIRVRHIGLLVLSLCGFAALSHLLNMTAGIFFLVFCAGFASQPYQPVRNLKLFICLWLIAYGFKQLLGLNLPLL